MHVINDIRFAQYINLVRIKRTDSEEITLKILNKIFDETTDSYKINLLAISLDDQLSKHQNNDHLNNKAYLLIDRSMFNMMHFAVDHANKSFLFPKLINYNLQIQEDLDINDNEKKFSKELNAKQIKLIKRILSIKTGQLTPPV